MAITLDATHLFFLTTLKKLTIMKTPVLFFLLFTSLSLAAQQTDFIVPANTQKVLTSAERTLSVKKFSIGDNATIVIPGTMDGWTVTATDATIGNDVKIIGWSSLGLMGLSGTSGANAPDCTQGSNGNMGNRGQPGSPGKNVSLNLNIRSIGILTIEVIGGRGGNGGVGGNGGKGGNSTCKCSAGGNGGNGGRGGDGGNSGAGGNVSIIYKTIGNVSVSNSNFTILNSPGQRGLGGNGGAGGQGGAGGGCSDPKALVKPAGAAGQNGARGNDGQNGSNGTAKITAG
jgi:hypothetical protein